MQTEPIYDSVQENTDELWVKRVTVNG